MPQRLKDVELQTHSVFACFLLLLLLHFQFGAILSAYHQCVDLQNRMIFSASQCISNSAGQVAHISFEPKIIYNHEQSTSIKYCTYAPAHKGVCMSSNVKVQLWWLINQPYSQPLAQIIGLCFQTCFIQNGHIGIIQDHSINSSIQLHVQGKLGIEKPMMALHIHSCPCLSQHLSPHTHRQMLIGWSIILSNFTNYESYYRPSKTFKTLSSIIEELQIEKYVADLYASFLATLCASASFYKAHF